MAGSTALSQSAGSVPSPQADRRLHCIVPIERPATEGGSSSPPLCCSRQPSRDDLELEQVPSRTADDPTVPATRQRRPSELDDQRACWRVDAAADRDNGRSISATPEATSCWKVMPSCGSAGLMCQPRAKLGPEVQFHALMHDPAARAIQQRFIAYAARDLSRLRDVLRHSRDAEHRALAAQVLGYAPNKLWVSMRLAPYPIR